MWVGEKENKECSQNRKTDQLIFTSSQCQSLCCAVQTMPWLIVSVSVCVVVCRRCHDRQCKCVCVLCEDRGTIVSVSVCVCCGVQTMPRLIVSVSAYLCCSVQTMPRFCVCVLWCADNATINCQCLCCGVQTMPRVLVSVCCNVQTMP